MPTMNLKLKIENDRKLTEQQIDELVDNLVAYAHEIIDDLTFLDEIDSEDEPKPKKKATKKAAPKKEAPAKKKGGK